MKKIVILLAVAVVGAFAARVIADDFTDLAGDSRYEGKTGAKKLATAIDANFQKLETTADTNATINLAAYTPGKIGAVLVGKLGGSNAVWIARSTATNGWQLIDLE